MTIDPPTINPMDSDSNTWLRARLVCPRVEREEAIDHEVVLTQDLGVHALSIGPEFGQRGTVLMCVPGHSFHPRSVLSVVSSAARCASTGPSRSNPS